MVRSSYIPRPAGTLRHSSGCSARGQRDRLVIQRPVSGGENSIETSSFCSLHRRRLSYPADDDDSQDDNK
jgi:hypothetical protein